MTAVFNPSRRDMLKAAGALAAATLPIGDALAQIAVPFSAGTEPPKTAVPAHACDAHIHIFSTRFPASPHWKGQPVADSDVAAYRLFQQRIGTSRTVVVTPSTYGIDNRATLDGVAQLGASARAVVVVDLDVTEAELKDMAARGAVGIRVNFVTPQSWASPRPRAPGDDGPEGPSPRLARPGLHDRRPDRRPCRGPGAPADPARHRPSRPPAARAGAEPPRRPGRPQAPRRRRTWMKLSGAYLNTTSGPPAYADATEVARLFAKAAPERMVWGSDWPHRGEKHMPDDAGLLDLLADWAPSEAARRRILVDNPATLYGFGRS